MWKLVGYVVVLGGIGLWGLNEHNAEQARRAKLEEAYANANSAIEAANDANEKAEKLEERLDQICSDTNGSLGC